MERFTKTLLRLLSPGMGWVLLLMPIGAAGVIIALTTGREATVFGGISYALSAYALAALIVGLPKFIKDIRTFINENKKIATVRAFLNENKYTNRYLTDVSLKVKASLYMSLSVNLLYAGFKMFTGIYYNSFWFGAEAIFYLVLGLTRYFMLMNLRKSKDGLRQEYQAYRFCGYMLFILNAALTGIVYQMIHQGQSREYPGLLIYIVATFTFIFLAHAIADVVKYRKLNSPALSAAKVITFVQALVAIFSLQVALFTTFGDDERLALIMNSIVGGFLCIVIFGLAVYMVVRGIEKLKKLR